MTPLHERLAQDTFQIEEQLSLFGRPVALILAGAWMPDGTCEARVGVIALEPPDFCRLLAEVHFVPGKGLSVTRTARKDDPRDDQGVIERFFERPLREILDTAYLPLGNTLANALAFREAWEWGEAEVVVLEGPPPQVH